MSGTTLSEMSAICQSIRKAITNIPTSVSRLSASGGRAITIAPTRGRLVVDPAHQLPCPRVRRGTSSESRWAVREEVAAEVEHHVLLEPRVDVAVDDGEAVVERR